MNPTVSIIVPVYNAAEGLPRCINSILQQEYTDFELILVNDGSTDASASICDEFAKTDSRIVIIHKENSGVSATRNLAIERAKGTYLQFIDSDDWITPDATRLLVETASEHSCDMVISDFYRVVGDHVSPKGDIEENRVMNQEEFASHMMENPADFYYGVLWNKLFKRSIIQKYHLRMDESLNWCEDFLFNMEYILHCDSFYALQTPIYYYVKTKGSLASQGLNISKTVKMKLTVFEFYNNFYKHILDKEDYEKNKLQVYRFLIDAAGDGSAVPLLPGSKRLGEERIAVAEEIFSDDTPLSLDYIERKFLEHYLESVALKHDLSVAELKLLLHLKEPKHFSTMKELADYLNLTRSRLSLTFNRLISKEYIRMDELTDSIKKSGKKPFFQLLPSANTVLNELDAALFEMEKARYAGFSEEEIAQYKELSKRQSANIRRILPQRL